MPTVIRTRTFALRPDQFAWPSFCYYSRRATVGYGVVAVLIGLLVWKGVGTDLITALLAGVGVTAAVVGYGFLRFKMNLQKPANRALYQDCEVTLSDDEIRQDYGDGSFVAFKSFAVKSVRQIGEYYFVIASGRHVIVALKTAFTSPEESREFFRRASEMVGKR